jgi:hypothetical protein
MHAPPTGLGLLLCYNHGCRMPRRTVLLLRTWVRPLLEIGGRDVNCMQQTLAVEIAQLEANAIQPRTSLNVIVELAWRFIYWYTGRLVSGTK